MKLRTQIGVIAILATSVCASYGQALGLNFASTDPDAGTSSLLPEEVAGVVPQANWNNLTLNNGTAAAGSIFYNSTNGTPVTSTISVIWASPNTWRAGANNQMPLGPDRKLHSGYLDSAATAATGVSVTITNLDPFLTVDGYDVIVYLTSDSTENRGGGYTLRTGTTNIVKYGSTLAAPTAYQEDPGTDTDNSVDGTYIRFRRVSGTGFVLTSDTTLVTPNPAAATPRAPIAAIQLVSAVFGPSILTQPVSISVYTGRVARFTATADGFPALTLRKWQKNGADLPVDTRITGVNTNTLVISNVTAGDVGSYTLVAVSSRGTATSQPATLSIATQENSPYVNRLVTNGLVANWRFDDPVEGNSVSEHISGLSGTYNGGIAWGPVFPGPVPPSHPGFASSNSAANFSQVGYVGVPALSLNTNRVSIVAWIRPFGNQAANTGILTTRTGTQAGLGFGTDNQLGYFWNNNSALTTGWASGLRPPANEWTMVVLVVEPTRATIFMGATNFITASVNQVPHNNEVWGNVARIGDDSGGTTRQFIGDIDEVAVFNRALSMAEIATLYADATGVPQTPAPIISPGPRSRTLYAGATLKLNGAVTTTTAATLSWKHGTTNMVDGGRVSGATTDTLVIANINASDAGAYTMTAVNTGGSTTSTPATLTVLTPPNAYVNEIIADGPTTYWRLNEIDTAIGGTTPLLDLWGPSDGTYGTSALNGFNATEGPRPSSGFAGFESDNYSLRPATPTLTTANTFGTVTPPGVNTNIATFLGWINPITRVVNSGVLVARAGGSATGLILAGAGNVGYVWNDVAATYNFNSNLTPPTNEWSLVAVTIETNQAIVYLANSAGVRTATNVTPHALRNFNDNIRLGGDPNNVNRSFNGRVDEIAMFTSVLSSNQIARLYTIGVGTTAPVIATQPLTREEFVGDTLTLNVAASGTAPLAYRWERLVNGNYETITNGGKYSGATTSALTITGATAAEATNYRAIVSNGQGSAMSDEATLSLIPQPPAPPAGSFGAAVLASGFLSYWRLNETGDPSSGALRSFDYGGRHATFGANLLNGFADQRGPQSPEFPKFEGTNFSILATTNQLNSWMTVPPLGIVTNTITIVAWIKPRQLVLSSGILFFRGGQAATGINLNGAGQLAYHWLDNAATYNFNTGFGPMPTGIWTMVAVSVETNQATVYQINTNGFRSATNTFAHALRTFSDVARIGNDQNAQIRTFDGNIDEVAVFARPLTGEQILGLYNGQVVVSGANLTAIRQAGGQVVISWDFAGQLQSTTNLVGLPPNWSNVTTTGNSITVDPSTGPVKFYRVVR